MDMLSPSATYAARPTRSSSSPAARARDPAARRVRSPGCRRPCTPSRRRSRPGSRCCSGCGSSSGAADAAGGLVLRRHHPRRGLAHRNGRPVRDGRPARGPRPGPTWPRFPCRSFRPRPITSPAWRRAPIAATARSSRSCGSSPECSWPAWPPTPGSRESAGSGGGSTPPTAGWAWRSSRTSRRSWRWLLGELWRDHRRARAEDDRQRSRLFLVAFAIGALGAVDFLPAFGVDLYPFGYVPVLAMLATAAATFRRYRLPDPVSMAEGKFRALAESASDAIPPSTAAATSRTSTVPPRESSGSARRSLAGRPSLSFIAPEYRRAGRGSCAASSPPGPTAARPDHGGRAAPRTGSASRWRSRWEPGTAPTGRSSP